MRRPRRNHSPVFKAEVALAAIEGGETRMSLSSWIPRPCASGLVPKRKE